MHSFGRRLLGFQRAHALGKVVHRTDVRAYTATRTHRIIEAHVAYRDGRRELLPQLEQQSPTSFDIGHAGEGPALLARSIIGHFLETTEPEPSIYQRFKVDWLASECARDHFVITSDELEAWLTEGAVPR